MPEGFRNADKEPHGLAKKPGHQPQQGYSLNELLGKQRGAGAALLTTAPPGQGLAGG